MPSISDDLLAFLQDRLKVYLRDQGVRHDLIDAVITPEADDLLAIVRRVEALGSFLATDEGKNLLAGTKRAANILAAEEKKKTAIADTVDPSLLREEPEKNLLRRGESGREGSRPSDSERRLFRRHAGA